MDAALSASYVNAEHVAVKFFYVKRRVFYCQVRGSGREVYDTVCAARLFFIKPVFRIEIFYFGGDFCGVLGCIELCDEIRAVFPALKGVPEFFFPDSDWGNSTATCDYHSSVVHWRHRLPPV